MSYLSTKEISSQLENIKIENDVLFRKQKGRKKQVATSRIVRITVATRIRIIRALVEIKNQIGTT